ncbi:hypothetical protein, partial [Longimicrobium sp.]|uniref:hypothetical protein n=1 Tax=Longimicrobium sp. TaxID=2029185 RepID=UPI002E34C036
MVVPPAIGVVETAPNASSQSERNNLPLIPTISNLERSTQEPTALREVREQLSARAGSRTPATRFFGRPAPEHRAKSEDQPAPIDLRMTRMGENHMRERPPRCTG